MNSFMTCGGKPVSLNPDLAETKRNYDLCKFKNVQLNTFFEELQNVQSFDELKRLYTRSYDYIFDKENATDMELITIHCANMSETDFQVKIDDILWINPFIFLSNFQKMFRETYGIKLIEEPVSREI